MKKSHILLIVLVIANVAVYWGLSTRMTQLQVAARISGTYPIPTPHPVATPEPVSTPQPTTEYTDQTLQITEDVRGARFENCTLEVQEADGLVIAGNVLVNSRIVVRNSSDVTIADNVIQDYYDVPDAVIRAYDSPRFTVEHNYVADNTGGMYMVGCPGTVIRRNIFERNDQKSGIILFAPAGVTVEGNLFRHNKPNAIYILSPDGNPGVQFDIRDNLITANVGDAIKVQTFRSSRTSHIRRNHITLSGWAGINIEWNSWNANIVIEGNYIDHSGMLTADILDEEGRAIAIYPNREDGLPYRPAGWGHGIRLEDCSGIVLRDNVIVNNRGNGVDVRNGRGITMEGDFISRNEIGLRLGRFHESALTRQQSPLSPENAGDSRVALARPTLVGNRMHDVLVEQGSGFDGEAE